jgi:putative membrane protein
MTNATQAPPGGDPRVFFAAERTLLAWLRTGLTLMALGFVISRFGLFIRLLASPSPSVAEHGRGSVSSLLGVAFVLSGSAAIFVSALQHRRFVATIAPADLPAHYTTGVALVLSLGVATLGLALAAYLGLVSR